MTKRSTRMPPMMCPACGALVNAATCLGNSNKPRPGDLSVCLRCAAVLTFDPFLRITLPPAGFYDGLRISDNARWRTVEQARVCIRSLSVFTRPSAQVYRA